MEILRTPDDRFAALPGYPYAPRYVQLGELRMCYVDEGPREGAVVLCLHGEPSWSYLYRKMIARGGHFIQEDAGEELAELVIWFIARTR